LWYLPFGCALHLTPDPSHTQALKNLLDVLFFLLYDRSPAQMFSDVAHGLVTLSTFGNVRGDAARRVRQPQPHRSEAFLPSDSPKPGDGQFYLDPSGVLTPPQNSFVMAGCAVRPSSVASPHPPAAYDPFQFIRRSFVFLNRTIPLFFFRHPAGLHTRIARFGSKLGEVTFSSVQDEGFSSAPPGPWTGFLPLVHGVSIDRPDLRNNVL